MIKPHYLTIFKNTETKATSPTLFEYFPRRWCAIRKMYLIDCDPICRSQKGTMHKIFIALLEMVIIRNIKVFFQYTDFNSFVFFLDQTKVTSEAGDASVFKKPEVPPQKNSKQISSGKSSISIYTCT